MKILINPTKEELCIALQRPTNGNDDVREQVRQIITQVEIEGDAALIRLNQTIDGYSSNSLEVSHDKVIAAGKATSTEIKSAMALAYKNIEAFHKAQFPSPIVVETQSGISCSLKYFPLERVGLYIPGGTAPLISTVLMLAIPASVAGCEEIIICTPPNPTNELLYAAGLFNARVFTVGGAQAVAAMAFGTKSIPRVDKIFGPGNRYVTEAKMEMAGKGVAIDMPAGPSEVIVLADETANPAFVAADLLSQAEHGSDSQVVLITTSSKILSQTLEEMERQSATLSRKTFVDKTLANSTAILVNSMFEAMTISNRYAPEHLILAVAKPEQLAQEVKSAGSVFLGHYSPESAGDYSSGTNHTLPTSRFARSWSGITTLSFMKSITFQQLCKEGISAISSATAALARAEGLEAHARAIEIRDEFLNSAKKQS
jgi:histidinol dehydrogenase